VRVVNYIHAIKISESIWEDQDSIILYRKATDLVQPKFNFCNSFLPVSME